MLYEYRLYTALPGKMGLISEILKEAVPMFEKAGMKVLGPWKPIVGENSTVVYMLGFENAADREQKWSKFKNDPEWKGKRAKFGTEPITSSEFNTLLKSPPYSPAK